MKLQALRSLFLEYFEKNDHSVIPSSSLVPYNDDTLLFTNAGMVQFKDVFLGREKRTYTRAASSQRCVRAGGKHNDLENVGYTARHHTFFEMLGNFSFGDYFKREAIQLAWNFLTKELKIPAEKLWVTVFQNDDEAADIWLKEIGINPQQFARCGEKDNFWMMGDTGPCGPCSEIYYDHGKEIAGGPPGSIDAEGDRYIEIWNLVFMQYNRAPDGSLTALPKPSVDTGMGLERLSAVMQGVHNNYEIDLFQNLIQHAAQIVETHDATSQSLKVLADHIRSCSFLILDGVLPSNEGRGYVLRRILRRAIRHGYKLGAKQTFFYKLVEALVREMGDAYPDLKKNQSHIEKVIRKEEEQFAKTLDQGIKLLEQELRTLQSKTIPGSIVFKLYDTYGFPMDLTADYAREMGLSIDEHGFEQAMSVQRARARASHQFQSDYHKVEQDLGESAFSGYATHADEGTVIALLKDGNPTDILQEGESGGVILHNTPFYAEAGGQVGDQGRLQNDNVLFTVEDTQKSQKAHVHLGKLSQGTLRIGDKVHALVDENLRQRTRLNHSATHLLHAALRKIVGPHVQQKGSLVAPDRLRFDFTHYEPLSSDQIEAIEDCVNDQILANSLVQTDEMPVEEALASGAMALFGEKYGEKVRVLKMGNGFSVELCGGTHVNRTGDIGLLKILYETGIAAGVRRIEAITGNNATQYLRETQKQLSTICGLLKVDRLKASDRVAQMVKKQRELEKENERLSLKAASAQGQDLTESARQIGSLKVLSLQIPGDPKMLRGLMDDLKNKLGSGVIVLAVVHEQKISLIAGVTKDYTNKISAGELVNFVATQVGGKGGGRADVAQAGGNAPENLTNALESVYEWVEQKI
ncbi:MAG TPA: alanine--tRNA ligase [Gammaproteobacteria bacterium]|nr:alanine--tRNA ligase [Gammaproteobacteria bacterium]